MPSTVDLQVSGPVAAVTLARPERLNALDDSVRDDLQAVVRALADDDAVRVVVLRGRGRSFCAGADLRVEGADALRWGDRRRMAARWQRLLDDVEALPQVTVASIQRHAIGGGVILACCCDLRVAGDDLALSVPEVSLGLPLPWAGLPRLVREVGLPRTRDLVMTGRVVDAEEALRWGLVQRVVPAASLAHETEALVAQLVAMPGRPLALTTGSLRALGRERLTAGWSDADLLAWVVGDQHREGR